MESLRFSGENRSLAEKQFVSCHIVLAETSNNWMAETSNNLISCHDQISHSISKIKILKNMYLVHTRTTDRFAIIARML